MPIICIKLTRADGDTVGGDSGVDVRAASLVGAVAKTVAEVGVGAQAGNVSGAATQVGGLSEHGVDAALTAGWDAANRHQLAFARSLPGLN